jgi:GNAT superfamily N-acetyltransferase
MLEVHPAASDEDFGHVARIVTAVSPDAPLSVEEIRWADAHYPGGQRFIAWLDGNPAGAGGAGRAYSWPADFPARWGNISVLPEFRRHGVGSAILREMAAVARAAGKAQLMGRTTSDRPAAIEFLEHRGFVEHERIKVVALELAGAVAPSVDAPAGIEITSLEARPDLVPAVYAVAVEAMPDIPGDGPQAPDTLEEFRVRDVDRESVPPGAFMVALDSATGDAVGYANLMLLSGTSRVAWNSMTAVRPAWRGRGVASALKRATIAWAIAHDLEGIETANDLDNAPMRTNNRTLGYQPRPDEVYFRGPVANL